MVRAEGVEPSSQPWEGHIIAVIRRPRALSLPWYENSCPVCLGQARTSDKGLSDFLAMMILLGALYSVVETDCSFSPNSRMGSATPSAR